MFVSFVHRIHSETGDFPCNGNAFGVANSNNEDNFCYVANNTMFVGAIGEWKIAASCAGEDCIIDEDIEYGVTSTSSEACSNSWTQSLTKTVSGSLSFKIFGISRSLTTEQATTVDNIVSNSYTQQSSVSCEAKCGNGSSNDWTLYQWHEPQSLIYDIRNFVTSSLSYADVSVLSLSR